MIKEPEVSIIVPNYNHAEYLNQRLDSIFDQTYQDFEVILLDDCSTDNSVDILTEFASNPKVSHFLISSNNSGSPFHQWKKGIELAKGKYIWIAESDDFSDLNFLKYMLKEFKRQPELGLCYCRSFRVNEKSQKQGILKWGELFDPESWDRNKYFNQKEYVVDYLRFRNTIPNVSAVLFRKDIIHIDDEIERFKLCGDWLLYVKLALKYPILYVSNPLNCFRKYSLSTTSNNISLKKEKLRIKEYFTIINFANKKTSLKFNQNLKMYLWICAEWINNQQLAKESKSGYYFPNIPLSLKFSFYKMLIFRLLCRNRYFFDNNRLF